MQDRETVKRKWSADKSAGPLVLLAEWLLKRLIQHAWPCEYVVQWSDPALGPEVNANQERDAQSVAFRNAAGRPPLSDAFWDTFDCALRVLTHEKDVRAYRDGDRLILDGVYHVNKYGVIRRGPAPAPF